MKTQIKKSISLFLAVLMILSCWVWVAPEKAEAAAEYEEGKYYVKYVIGEIREAGNSGSWNGNTLTFTWAKTDGDIGTTTINLDKSKYNTQGAKDVVIWEGYLDGFPKSASWHMEMKWQAAASVYLSAGDCKFMVGSDKTSCETVVSNTDGFKWQSNAVGNGAANATLVLNAESGFPVAASAGKVDAFEIDIPKLGSGTTSDKKDIAAPLYDQYGVKLLGYKASIYKIGDDNGNFYNENQGFEISVSNNKATVKIDENAQKTVLGSTATKTSKVYLYASYEGKISEFDNDGTMYDGDSLKWDLVSDITLKYPNYTVNFDQKGLNTDDRFAPAINLSGDATATAAWGTSGIYGEKLTTYPLSGKNEAGDILGATVPGYIFKGFWTVKQPDSGKANWHEKIANFAEPISQEKFDEYVDSGVIANGAYITVDGKTYYNAGEAWDSETFTVENNVEYFGWWLATEIPVKFYDIDGRYLGTKSFKYGKIHPAADYFDPSPEYTSGAFTYSTFEGNWMDVTGVIVAEGSYKFGTDNPEIETYMLTPTYGEKTFKSTYEVKFVDPEYGFDTILTRDYRHVLSGSEILSAEVFYSLSSALDYRYEFAGWSSEVPANGAYYHVVDVKDADSFVNQDWVVREDITYYAVYKRALKEYQVEFKYTDATGTLQTVSEVVTYGSIISTPSYVNKTYTLNGIGKNLTHWTFLGGSFKVDDVIVFDSTNMRLTAANVVGGARAFAITAAYDAGTPMPYTITFKYKNARGEDRTIVDQVYRGATISEDTVAKLVIPEEYDDGAALYTFANKWIVVEGAADQEEYEADDFTSFSPTTDVVFEAVYDDGVPFYTVKYIDGSKEFTKRILKGSKLPIWPSDDSEDGRYEPADKEEATGVNKFDAWVDAEGTKYTPNESVVESDLVLYPQFKFEPFKYTITFLDHTGEVQLASGEYEYGQSYGNIFYPARTAALGRPADDTYTYEFIGWDQPYDEEKLLCEGKDVTFRAQYKASYIYYEANWYNDKDAMTGGAAPVTTTKHTYNSSVYNPAVTLTAQEGYAFAGWYYLVDGKAVAFHRGMKITGEMNFFAEYSKLPVTYTVTTVVGTENNNYTVGEGMLANAVPTPASGYADATNHKKFAGWYTRDDYAEGSEFDIDTTAINEDITIYAKYEFEAHIIDQYELISVPTYYQEGEVHSWCACAKKDTLVIEKTSLTDKVAPTGTIHLGSAGKWSSNKGVSGAEDTNEYYANPNTEIVITINDKGDGHPAYNPSAAGIGIRMIRVFVSSDTFTQEQQGIASQLAETIFLDTSTEQNNIANYAIKLSELKIAALNENGEVQYDSEGNIITKDLEDGEEYIVYYFAIDKANNILNKNVRTAKFTYDTEAPEFEIKGYSNKAYATGTVTYCGSAVISNVEVGATIEVDGKEVQLTSTSAAGIGSYTIEEAGSHIITVTDKAGNKKVEKINVAEDHRILTTSRDTTCTVDGYYKVECALCEKVIEYVEYKSAGHSWIPSVASATCEERGYTLNTCDTCGVTEKIYTYIDLNGNEVEIEPALGHVYEMNGEEIVYTVAKKATCKAEGKLEAKCLRCGDGVLTKTIPVDTENGHIYGGLKTLSATCTENGKTYKRCKYCYETLDIDVLEATGHKMYTKVTKEATCAASGEKETGCSKCNLAKVIETIPATGKHVSVVDTMVKPAVGVKGSITYKCKYCTTWSKTVEVDALVGYTVKFVDEAGNIISKEDDVVVGTSIEAPAAPAKAETNENKYTFAGWADESGKIVDVPFNVTGNVTLKATYKATTKIYTHIFMVPTKWVATLADDADYGYETYATVIGAYNSANKKPSVNPKFVDSDADADAALKATATIVFKGWKNSEGNFVTDFTMVDDDNFYAVFEAIPVQYNAVFYNYDGSYLAGGKFDVNSNVAYDGEAPTRASDDNYEYNFLGWTVNGGDEIVDLSTYTITGKTTFVAKFEAVNHNYVKVEDESYDATCTEPGKLVEKCSKCEKERDFEVPAGNHDYVTQEDGSKICDNCGDKIAAATKFYTITFVDAGSGDPQSIAVAEGSTVEISAKGEWKSESTVYTFANWTDAEGNVISNDVTVKVTVTGDATYNANYSEAVRMYKVVYYGYNYEFIADYDVAYGAEINKILSDLSINAPQPANSDLKNWYNEDTHYLFTGKWQINGGEAVEKVSGVVTDDMEICADYIVGKHIYEDQVTDATCTEPGGVIKVCRFGCGKTGTTEDSIPALGHEKSSFVKVETQEDVGVEGVYIYHCDRCKKDFEVKVNALKGKDMVIRVYDLNGNVAQSAKINLYYNNGDGEVYYKTFYTDADGYMRTTDGATIQIPRDYKNWRATVEFNGGSYSGEVKFGIENVFGGPKAEEEAPKCPCTCHKNTFWGAIYRFFQKILGIFGAKPCCECCECN